MTMRSAANRRLPSWAISRVSGDHLAWLKAITTDTQTNDGVDDMTDKDWQYLSLFDLYPVEEVERREEKVRRVHRVMRRQRKVYNTWDNNKQQQPPPPSKQTSKQPNKQAGDEERIIKRRKKRKGNGWSASLKRKRLLIHPTTSHQQLSSSPSSSATLTSSSLSTSSSSSASTVAAVAPSPTSSSISDDARVPSPSMSRVPDHHGSCVNCDAPISCRCHKTAANNDDGGVMMEEVARIFGPDDSKRHALCRSCDDDEMGGEMMESLAQLGREKVRRDELLGDEAKVATKLLATPSSRSHSDANSDDMVRDAEQIDKLMECLDLPAVVANQPISP